MDQFTAGMVFCALIYLPAITFVFYFYAKEKKMSAFTVFRDELESLLLPSVTILEEELAKFLIQKALPGAQAKAVASFQQAPAQAADAAAA